MSVRPLTIDPATGLVGPASVNGHPLTLPSGARMADFNSLGDARWVQLANLNSLGDARWVQLVNLNALGDARWALDSAAVHKTGPETIAGVKTFSSAPVVPSGAFPETAVVNLVSDLAGKVPVTRTVNGQPLSANVLLSTADVNDSTDRRYVTDAQRAVIQNTSGVNTGDQDLSPYAPLASPALAGIPTAPTAALSNNSTQIATTAFVHGAIDALVNGAEAALDTLKELADQMRSDETAVASLTTTVAGKLAKASNLSDLTDAAIARTNLGGTTVGKALFTLANPGAITFLQLNADNSVTAQNASAQKTALGMGNVENTALSTWAGTANITTLGTIATGTWHGSVIAEIYGGTNQNSYTLGDLLYASASNTLSKLAGNTSTTKKFLSQTGNGTISAAPSWAALAAGDIPTLNQNTTGSAATLSISGQSALLTFTGLASTNRAKTVRDAADTLLELGGSYTPAGTWTNMTLVTPALGTPSALVLTNATGSPTGISLTKAQLNTIVSDDDVAYLGAANTFTANQIFGQYLSLGTGTSNVNVGLGFNRNAATGAIFDSSRYAFQFVRTTSDTFDLGVWNGAGTQIVANAISVDGPTGKVSVVQEAWTAPTLLNSWANFGSGFRNAGYRKDSTGRIWIRGMVTGGTTTANTAIFTLPPGYRPSAEERFIVISADALGQLSIDTSGNVKIVSGSATWFSFNGISFATD